MVRQRRCRAAAALLAERGDRLALARGELRHQVAVVGEEEQSFGVVVEAPDGVDVLAQAGHEVEVLHPPALLGRLKHGAHGAGKWLGYVDKYGVFPPLLRGRASSGGPLRSN